MELPADCHSFQIELCGGKSRRPSASETRVPCAFQPARASALQQISLLIMCIELHFEFRPEPLRSPLTYIEFNIFAPFRLLEDKLHSSTVPAVAEQTGVALDDSIG
jgi:hypothetical protein